VLSVTEAPRDSHLLARATYEERDGIVQPAAAPRFVGRPAAAASAPPPLPGEHTREALTDWGVGGVDAWLDAGAAIQREGDR